jgi:hypothetical protein
MNILAFMLAFGMAAAICAITGVAQWLVLRRYLKRSGLWVLATFAGWTIGLALVVGVVAWVGMMATKGEWSGAGTVTPLRALLLGPFLGVILGGFQTLVLRQHVQRAGRWMGASVVGMTVGFLPSVLLTLLQNAGIVHRQIPLVPMMMSFGVLYGWITGRAMLRLLRGSDGRP